MSNSREISQFSSFIYVDDKNRNIGIATTATPYVGIGTTNPTSKLYVVGDGYFTGVVTASNFSGNVSSATYATSAGIATALQTARTFEITGDIVASPISFDGTGNVSLAATIQPNSVALGSDTTGDYVQTVSGTLNQITVTGGTGEGSTPTLSLPNNLVIPQDAIVTRDLQVNRNLNVTGNITIGGTTAFINVQELRVTDPDLVLGFRTDAFGNDSSTDNTANHGGIAIASTEGTPLTQLFIAGIETTPSTYKKIMWFKAGTFAGLGTDAWLSNYAIGIGSTQFPVGTRLAAGSVQFTERDLVVVRNINASGVVTASSFSGNASSATYASVAGIATYAVTAGVSTFSGYANVAGIATYATNAGLSTYATSAGISTYSNNAGIATYAVTAGVSTFSGYANVAGVSTFSGYANVAGVSTFSEYASVAGIATYAVTAGVATNAQGLIGTPNITVANITAASLNSSGIVTGSSFRPSTGYYQSANGTNAFYVFDTSGDVSFQGKIVTNYIRSNTNLNPTITVSDLDLQFARNVTISGITTSTGGFVGNLTGTASTASFATTAYNLTDAANITTGTINSARLSGTYNININGNASSATYATSAGIATYSNNAGIATSVIGGIASVTQLNVSGVSTFNSNVGIKTLNATSALYVVGDTYITGILTANRIFSSIYGEFTGSSVTSDSLVGTALSISGISTLGITSATNLTAQQLNVTGLSTFAGITTVTGETLFSKQLNVSGVSTFKGNVNLADNASLYLGDGNDLRIFHNGSNSFISEVGTGGLFIDASSTTYRSASHTFKNGGSTENLAIFTENSSVELYYDNSKKFETSGVGATVYGTLDTTQLNVSGFSTFVGVSTFQSSLFGSQASFTGVVTASSFSGNASSSTYSTSAGIATYATSADIATYATNAGIATNLKGGAGGSIPYQTAADTTTFLANGISGYILQANGGTSAPSWVPAAPASAITGLTIRDEGTIVGTANSVSQLNFVGATVTATASGSISTITVSAPAGMEIRDEGTIVGSAITSINIVGAGITATASGTATTITSLSPTGGGTDAVFYLNDNTINNAYTIPSGKNALSVGPLTINATVTISANASWVVIS